MFHKITLSCRLLAVYKISKCLSSFRCTVNAADDNNKKIQGTRFIRGCTVTTNDCLAIFPYVYRFIFERASRKGLCLTTSITSDVRRG